MVMVREQEMAEITPPVPVAVPELERLLDKLIRKFEPVDRLNLEDYPLSANADVPPTPIAPVSPPCLFRIMAAFSTGGVLSAVIRVNSNTHVLKLFEGNSLLSDCLYMCDINVHRGDRISLRYSADTTIRVLRIQEISRGV